MKPTVSTNPLEIEHNVNDTDTFHWKTEEDGTIRILTFQSEEVLDLIKTQEIYYADDSRKRERRSYELDVKQLNGYQPVWGFALPYEYDIIDIYRGSIFINFKCEMSLSESILSDFVCLELFVPSELVKLGLTHNACYFAVVYPYVKKEFLHRVYKVEYTCGKHENGQISDLPIVETIEVFNDKHVPTFEQYFSTLSATEFRGIKDQLTVDFPFKRYEIGKRYSYEDTNIELNLFEGCNLNKDMEDINLKSTVSTNPLESPTGTKETTMCVCGRAIDLTQCNSVTLCKNCLEVKEPWTVTSLTEEGKEVTHTIEVKFDIKSECHILQINDGGKVDIFYNPNKTGGQYSIYDGVEGFGWYNTPREAVDSYIKEEFLKDLNNHAECSSCGGGGCIHCDPNFFY